MITPVAPSNHSFTFLKNSTEFLNIILDEISSCILLLNKDMMLYAFNEPLRTIFNDDPDEDILFRKCGEVIGCAYSVEEEKECGLTSHCKFCELRETALDTYLTHERSGKKVFSREFYRHHKEKTIMHLRFGTRYFKYENEGFVILTIDDVTDLVNARLQK